MVLDEYRQNVGIVLIKNKLIFAGFRIDMPEHCTTGWQIPQGGIEQGEGILEAGYREMYEETGIQRDKVKIVKILPQTFKYDFTPEVITKMNERNKIINYTGPFYKGQEQHFVVFEFLGNDDDVNLKPTEEPQEFSKFAWKTADFLIENVYQMKKDIYQKVFSIFKEEKIVK